MARMRRLLLLLAVLAAGAAPGTAAAKAPCRDKVFNDWYRDGKIASSYPLVCYRDALRHIPADARVYSSLGDDIRAALQAAIDRSRGKQVPAEVGRGLGGTQLASATTPSSPRTKSTPKTTTTDPGRGADRTRTVRTGPQPTAAPVASTSSGGGVPLPVLVLGGVALALIASGAIGFGVRRMRRDGL
jgi:hypothetical protein